MKRIVALVCLALAVLLALVWAGDYALLRYRMHTSRNPFGVVRVEPYYAVPRKDGRVEFLYQDPQDQTCVNSLFPRAGYAPCWYLNRHREKRIDA